MGDSADQRAPRDLGKLIYMTFYLLGMGSLLPWNIFISGKPIGE